MTFAAFKKSISIFLVTMIMVSQVFMLSVFLIPKPAEASFGSLMSGLGSAVKQAFSVPEWNWYEVLKDISIGILRGAAARASERFLTDFINKTTEKYKIRNYLYYEKVLSDYYLNRYLQDKIDDPDLRAIYSLLERSFISGQPTGTTGGQDPRRALIPGLKNAISKYYVDNGGIDPNKVFYPKSGVDDLEYFRTAQAYWANPIDFTEQNLKGEYGAFQTEATTAAQLEIIVGNGLKAGRIIGGTCTVKTAKSSADPDPNKSPDGCRKAGGTWQASALDQARSFIDNPTLYIRGRLDAAILKHMDKNFDPNNFWVEIGGHIGNFLVNQLGLKETTGTLPDDPRGYNPLGDEDYSKNPSSDIDFDGDGIADGADYDDDGDIDACYFGGKAPDCIGSDSVLGSGGTGGGFIDCDTPPLAISPDPTPVSEAVKAEFPELDLVDESPGGGRDRFTAIVAWRLHQGDPNWGRKKAGAANPISTDTLGYLRPDQGTGRFEAVDLIGGGTGTLQRGCYGVVDSGQVWIQPEPAP